MKILIDLGHPAHVHYFRNFIKLMEAKGHTFFVSARQRSIIHYLLQYYNIPFFNRGKGKNGVIGKLWYMLVADIKLFIQSVKFKPDLYISFASPYAAQVAWFRRTPHIVLDDTEHARFGHMFYKPFSSVFLNPACFEKDFGNRQLKFNSYTELFYLHPNYYKPNINILNELGVERNEKYVLLRFVSWQANHDIGHSGIDNNTKKELLELLLQKGYRIFISTEEEAIDDLFKPYLIKIKPENIHDVLFYSSLFIAESGTMASEAAVLGTPVVYVNSLPLMGYLKEQQSYEMLYHFPNSKGVFEKVKFLIEKENLKADINENHTKMLQNKIDPTRFLIWFIENYPQSITLIKENPDLQLQFI